MGRGDSDDGQAMSRTAQCDGHGEYGVTEDLAGDDVHPAAHHHCQEIYLTGSNGSNPSDRDRRKPATLTHSEFEFHGVKADTATGSFSASTLNSSSGAINRSGAPGSDPI